MKHLQGVPTALSPTLWASGNFPPQPHLLNQNLCLPCRGQGRQREPCNLPWKTNAASAPLVPRAAGREAADDHSHLCRVAPLARSPSFLDWGKKGRQIKVYFAGAEGDILAQPGPDLLTLIYFCN